MAAGGNDLHVTFKHILGDGGGNGMLTQQFLPCFSRLHAACRANAPLSALAFIWRSQLGHKTVSPAVPDHSSQTIHLTLPRRPYPAHRVREK